MTQVLLNIDDALAAELEIASKDENLAPADLIIDALETRLALQQWLRRVNAEVSQRAKELGMVDEDELLNMIS